MKKIVFSLLFILCQIWFPGLLTADEPEIIRDISKLPSQQKVYLHLDKTHYYAGDIIWFKGYITDSGTHRPDTAETSLFVEIFNLKGDLVQQKILKVEKGYTHGDFTLPAMLETGNYLLRAYTLWMLNFDQKFVFEQQLYIRNENEKQNITGVEARENRQFNRTLNKHWDNFSFTLFPEGGQLLAGKENRVAFRATDLAGRAINIQGYLSDRDGNRIEEFSTIFQGLGEFSFTPVTGKSYLANVTFPDGKQKTFPLEKPLAEGWKLSARVSDHEVNITVDALNNNSKTPENYINPILVIHTQGIIVSTHRPGNQYPFQLKVPTAELRPGISVITLFDGSQTPVAERLIFKKAPDKSGLSVNVEQLTDSLINISLHTSQSIDSMALSISLISSSGPIPANYENIESYMLLNSDLASIPGKPLKYLTDSTSSQYTDLLMRTYQWDRILWNDTTKDSEPEYTFPKKDGFPVFGTIVPTKRSIAEENTIFEVNIRLNNDITVQKTTTQKDGGFFIGGFTQTGKHPMEVTIMSIDNSVPETLELFPFHFDNTQLTPGNLAQEVPHFGKRNWQWLSAPQTANENRIFKIGERGGNSSIGNPDHIIYVKEEEASMRNMRDLIRRETTGINIEGNQIIIRGKNSMYLPNPPYITIDRVPFSSIQFLQTPLTEISHIEIFKGANASIFGMRAANGAIMAYSRRAREPKSFVINYVLDGYYVPREFAAVQKGLREQFLDDNEYQHTILWQPKLVTRENGNVNIRISTEGLPPFFRLTIEGIDQQGNIIHSTSDFSQ